MAGHYPEILISGQRLDARKASVFDASRNASRRGCS